MPLLVYWLADRAATRGGDCLFVNVLPTWQIMRAGGLERLELRSNSLSDGIEIDGLPKAAFDVHTREGKSAIQKLLAEPDVAGALPHEGARFETLCAAVFIVEGSRLSLRVSAPGLDDLRLGATLVELAYFGLSDDASRSRLLRTAVKALPTLRQARRVEVEFGHDPQALTALKTANTRTPSPNHLQQGIKLHSSTNVSQETNLPIIPETKFHGEA